MFILFIIVLAHPPFSDLTCFVSFYKFKQMDRQHEIGFRFAKRNTNWSFCFKMRGVV